jgi:LPS export ABC transporter protein LptC
MEVRAFRSVLVALAAWMGLAGLLAGCSREEPGQAARSGEQQLPDQIISNFSLTETAGGKKDWSMDAVKAYVYDRRNVIEADLVRITFFDEAGGVRSVLNSRNGRLDRNSNDMEARGDVLVTSSGGAELRTQSLTWKSRERQIVSDDSVTVVRRGDVLTGWGFRGDPDLGKFEILRAMKATIRPDDEGIGAK